MKSFYKLSKKQQMSEAFINNAFLALSGGFQDAYTYNTRNEVFSNAQTGNVVLMSQNLMTGNWQKGLRYLVPLLAFAGGVLVAERIAERFRYAKTPLETEHLADGDPDPVCCRIHAGRDEHGSNCTGILCMCHAGTGIS